MSRPTGSKNTGAGITRADFAKLTGWSLTKVHEMCRAGLLPLLPQAGKPMRAWQIDPKVRETMKQAGQLAHEEWEHPPMPRTDDATLALNGQTTGDVADYWRARAQKEAANAKLAELKLAEEEERLLDRDELEELLFTMARIARDRILAVPDRVQLPRDLRILVHTALTEALEALCEDIHGLRGYSEDDNPDLPT
jgi:hypothetical protein